MYGFHKIPHLQQGVLKSENETEFWNFAHANFHRGQPDLLYLIQQKKPLRSLNLPGGINFGGALPAAAGTTAEAIANAAAPAQNGNAALSSLDIQSIANGITAIKRHQSTISSELSELKRSNQLLWQDALASRGRQQKQQDTINRIVKFLAGVFGQHVNSAGTPGGGTPGVAAGQYRKDDGVDGATGMGPGTRGKMMLMIEDAKRDGPKKNVFQEHYDIPLDDPNLFNDTSKCLFRTHHNFISYLCIGYPSIETPVSVGSPSPSLSTNLSDNTTVTDAGNNPTPSPTTPGPELAGSTTSSTSIQQPQQEKPTRTVSLSRSPSLPVFDYDPRNVLNHLSPAQFQQLLASLASQTLLDPSPTTTDSAPPASTVNPNAANLNTESNLTPYHQPYFDFSQPTNFGYPFIAPESLIPLESHDPSSSSPSTTLANGVGANGTTSPGDMNLALLNAASSQEQREHEERMGKEWESAEMMEHNVNGLHSRIHSLAQALGLDPALLDNDLGDGTGAENNDENDDNMDELQMGLQGQQPTVTTTAAGTTTGTEAIPSLFTPPATTTAGATPTTDFDFDSFFKNIASSTTDLDSGIDYTSTTFLNEVPTPASSSDQAASPALSLRQSDVPSEASGVEGSGSTFTATGGEPTKGSRKRKSEVAMSDLDIPGTAPLTTPATKTTTGGNKAKRRKDK